MSQDLDSTQIGAPPPPERYDPLPESDGPPRGIGAARQHPFLIAFVAIIFAAAGAYVGYSRPATYTSSAVLQVGKGESKLARFLRIHPVGERPCHTL